MFEIYNNHADANFLLNAFKNDMKFVDYKEEQKLDRQERIIKTVYRAITPDGERNIEVIFPSQHVTKIDIKNHIGTLSFVESDSKVLSPNKIKSDKYQIADLLKKVYSPNFEKVAELVKWFSEEGEKSSVINVVDQYFSSKNYYSKKIEDHLLANTYDTKITINDVNMATVYFNNILQKSEPNIRRNFKVSFINIDIMWLVHSDNTMHPYFNLKLPYFENKKVSCVMPLEGNDKIYFYYNNIGLTHDFIDTRTVYNLEEKAIRAIFKQNFENEIRNAIVKKLKINKSVLKDLPINELKEYFILVEMSEI